jgi:hypothetical protein
MKAPLAGKAERRGCKAAMVVPKFQWKFAVGVFS